MNYSNMNQQRVPWLELLWITTYSGARVKMSTSAVLSALGGAAKYSLATPLKMKLVLSLRESRRLAAVEPKDCPAMAMVQHQRARYEALHAASLYTQANLLGNPQTFNFIPDTCGGFDFGAFSIAPLGRPRSKPYFPGKVDFNDFELLLDDELSSIDNLTEKLLSEKMGEKERDEDSVVLSTAELVTAVRDFVNQRDSRSWKHISSVQKEAAAATGYSKHLEKLLVEQNSVMREQEEEIAKLKASCAALKAEKEEAASRSVASDARLHAAMRECNTLRRLNAHLEVRCFEAESENEVLRGHLSHLSHVGEVAAAAVEASLSREGSLKEDGNDLESTFSAAAIQQEALTRTIAVALEGLETQREKAEVMARKLDEQLATAVGEMEERETHINWLQNSLKDLQRRKAQTERFVEEELRSERDREVSGKEGASHDELVALLEVERRRYSQEAERLERELEVVERERETAISHISSLEDSLERVGEEALGTLMSSEKLQNAIHMAYSSPSKTLRCDFFIEWEMPRKFSREFPGGIVLNEEFQKSLNSGKVLLVENQKYGG